MKRIKGFFQFVFMSPVALISAIGKPSYRLLAAPGLFKGWRAGDHRAARMVAAIKPRLWQGALCFMTYTGLCLFVSRHYEASEGLAFRIGYGHGYLLGFWPYSAHYSPLGTVALVLCCGLVLTTVDRARLRLGIFDPFLGMRRARPRLFGCAVSVAGWFNRLKFGTQKTGGWAPLIEVLATPYRRGDLFLGPPRLWTNGGLLRPVGLPTQKHAITVAESGAGKTVAAALTNIILHEGSCLIVDVKGELATDTARRRGTGGNGVKGMGQDVYVLDPFGIAKDGLNRAHYNPFDELAAVGQREPGRAISYAGKIAEALIKSSGGSDNEFFYSSARQFVRGLVLHILVSSPPTKRNLRQLRRFLMEGDTVGYQTAKAAGKISSKSTPFDFLSDAMQKTPEGPYREVIAGAAASVEQMGDRQRGAVISTAQESTGWLDLPEILDTTDSSDFLLQGFKSKQMSVYLCLPLNLMKGNAGGWLRLFVILFIDMMMLREEALDLPILLLLDEFPNIGRIDGIEIVAPVMRSYGVRLWVIVQDLGQLKTVYPGEWETFIGCAQMVQFMAIKHPETVNYLVRLLGERLVRTRTPDGRIVERPVPLLDAEQVSRFLEASSGNQIIWRGDRRPMRLKVAPYFRYLPFWMYSPDPRFEESWLRAWSRRRAVKREARPALESLPAGTASIDRITV